MTCKRKNQITKKVIGLAFALVSLLIIAACGAGSPASPPASSASAVQAVLKHAPTGAADLTWDMAKQTLTVKVSLTGLAPNSTHPEHIHAGNCKSDGPVVYPLEPVKANSLGVGSAETTIKDVKDGIPASGWYLNVHNGPDMTSALETSSIACGDIANPGASTKSNQSVHVALGETTAPNQSVNGTAQLSLANNKLTVKVTVSGLQPNSKHIAHVHKGSCDAQGAVLYTLTPIVADSSGHGTSTTVVDNVTSIPATGWYVNVHQAATMSEIQTQTGFDPLACGDVVAQ